MASQKKTHVVVTRVTPVREGGRTIVHTYGLHTHNRALEIRRRMMSEALAIGYRERLEVSACKMLDPKAWRPEP